ncbi:TonB-dependent receptor plug domain-containing protein [Yoonia maritima]|uniref:TonB-dependent receptor plug domain-containing protein n=1 Tax=Yoonia maritima TaxID=1435347 RepID=UPI000D0FA0A8|nr:TonB-dependent receptor [Yoonia maritima]
MAKVQVKTTLLSTTSLVFGLLVAQAAVAQEETFLGTIELAESKRDVQTDTAVAVTKVDQEEIDDRQAGTIAELIDSVPGVSLINGSTPQSSGINIRGYGANGTYGSDQKVAIIVDGASVGSEELYRIGTQLYTDPELYKSVSVIRGTVGSFAYGSGIVGGVVQLDTKDASDFTDGEIGFKARETLQFSSNGDGVTSSTILAWQPTENMEFLANYTQRYLDVQTDGVGEDIGEDGIELPSGLIKGRYTFGQNNDQAITLSYTDTRTDEKGVPYDAFSGNPMFGYVNRETHTITSALNYEYNPVGNDLIDLNVTLSYSDQEIEQEDASGGTSALLNADHQYQTTKLRAENTSLFATGAVNHTLQSGLELIHKDRLTASSAPGGSDDRVAVFLIDELQFGDSFTLTPALRAETSHIEGDTAPTDGTYDNDAVMGGISARYAFESGFAVFGSAAYTENLPILDDLGNATYMTQSEKAETFEVGASFDNLDVITSGDSLSVKANVYQTTLWDVTSYSGVSKVETEGVEIEASYSLETGIYVDVNANIVDGTSYDATGTASDWRNTPANSLLLAVGKKFGEELDLSFETVVGADITRNGTEYDGYVVNNLRATYVPQSGILEGTQMRLGVENAFDVDYTPSLAQATRPAPGRNVKLTLARTF